MKKVKAPKSVVVCCSECGASAQNAFLTKVRGTSTYICDDCTEDDETSHYKSYSQDDDSYDAYALESIGEDFD